MKKLFFIPFLSLIVFPTTRFATQETFNSVFTASACGDTITLQADAYFGFANRISSATIGASSVTFTILGEHHITVGQGVTPSNSGVTALDVNQFSVTAVSGQNVTLAATIPSGSVISPQTLLTTYAGTFRPPQKVCPANNPLTITSTMDTYLPKDPGASILPSYRKFMPHLVIGGYDYNLPAIAFSNGTKGINWRGLHIVKFGPNVSMPSGSIASIGSAIQSADYEIFSAANASERLNFDKLLVTYEGPLRNYAGVHKSNSTRFIWSLGGGCRDCSLTNSFSSGLIPLANAIP